MKFWDSSAIVSLVIEEARTTVLRGMREEDPEQTVWCLTEVEIASALARREREGLGEKPLEAARVDIAKLVDGWRPVTALEPTRARALRLVRTHALCAADALQLAAALVASEERPESLPFVCLDDRLRDAARREGFTVVPP
jgi:predicted nucleic acid-binding protein